MSSQYLNRYETGTATAQRTREMPEDSWGDYESLLDESQNWGDSSDPFLNSDISQGASYTPKTLSKKEALQMIRERCVELRKNKDLSGLGALEKLANSISRAPGQKLSPDLTAALLEKTGAAPAASEDFDLEGFVGSENSEGTSIKSLRSELNQLKNSIENKSDYSTDQKEGRLEQINKWLLALDLKPSEESLATIREGMESLKLGEDIQGDYGEVDEEGGDSPTGTKDGVRYYESKSSQDFSLVPMGNGTENIVSTSGAISISPQDPKAPVTITQEGEYTVIKVKGVKEDVYKIKGNVSKIQIDSEKVTGDYKNEDEIVTVGAKREKFISPDNYIDAAKKLRAGADRVGGTFIEDEGVKLEGNQKYSADTEEKNKDVKEILGAMADAMAAKDPKKRDKLWEDALDSLTEWMNCDSNLKGSANDRAAMVCRVLHGEFGKDGFKQLLKDGIIPRSFATKLGEVISIKADELFETADANRGAGSLGWNHKTYADFLEKNSSPIGKS